MKKADREIEIISFQKESPALTLKLKKEKPMEYDFGMLYYQVSEMRKGFIPKKIFKTTKTGTKITFVPITEESMKVFQPIFEESAKNFVEKWKVNPLYVLFPELEKGGEK